MGLLVTLIAGSATLLASVAASISGVYWTQSDLSLYGMLLFQLLFLWLTFTVLLIGTAYKYKDWSALLLHGNRAQRRFFCFGILCSRYADQRGSGASASHADKDNDEQEQAMEGDDVLLTSAGGGGGGGGAINSIPSSSTSVAASGAHDSSSIAATSNDNDSNTINDNSNGVIARWLLSLSQSELLFLMGLNNTFAAVTQWYATPPDRTPPLLQAIFPMASIVATIPMSKAFLGDRKVYAAPEPIAAVVLILAAVIVSLTPTLIGGEGSGGDGTGDSVPAWSAIFLLSQVLTALAFVSQQAYLIREGVLQPGTPWRRVQTSMARYLTYNQIAILLFLAALWWMDILPWWGSTPGGIQEWVNGIDFSFSCSLLGPSGVGQLASDGGACLSSTPLWGMIFVISYVVYLFAAMMVNGESAVFTSALNIVTTLVLATFWLIPGTNPDPSTTPLWSIIVAVVLSCSGMLILKRWEMKTPAEEQFTLQPLPCMLLVEGEVKQKEMSKRMGGGVVAGDDEHEEPLLR